MLLILPADWALQTLHSQCLKVRCVLWWTLANELVEMLRVNLGQGFQLPLPVVFLFAPVCVERIYYMNKGAKTAKQIEWRWSWSFTHLIRHRDSARKNSALLCQDSSKKRTL